MTSAPMIPNSPLAEIVSSSEVFNEHCIEVLNVTKSYGRIQALRGVSLAVRKGEIFGLLGANGAGKSTLLKILVGSTVSDSGKTKVSGLEPYTDRAQLRHQIGYMPQLPALYEDLSPRENIRFFGRAHHLPDLSARVEEILTFAQLKERASDPVFSFSGGMKQRVSLACALVHQPRVLFLDEPTAGVDPKLREALWTHFRDLASEGVTLLISTHLMDEALLCDRLAIMRDGAVLANDTPRAILDQGQSQVKIWRGAKLETKDVTNYPTELPRLLQSAGLDPSITRLEVQEDSLETIMLRMINATNA